MAVRLLDIANEVGVTVPVVSKVLNGGSSTVATSEATRQRVIQAAERLGYCRNGASVALRGQRFQSVGLLMGGAEDDFFLPQNMIAGLTQSLSARGYTCSLAWAGDFMSPSHTFSDETTPEQRAGTEPNTLPIIRDKMVDAMILGYAQDPPEALRRRVERLGVPVIWLHREDRYNAVAYDEGNAMDQVVDHLVARDVREITYFDQSGTRPDAPASRERLSAFHSSCKRHGIKPHTQIAHRVPRAKRAMAFSQWLDGENRTHGVIGDSLTSAQIFLDVAFQRGLDLPRDLAIASFDNGDHTSANAISITAAVTPERALGSAVAEMAIELIESSRMQTSSVRLPYSLFEGQTT